MNERQICLTGVGVSLEKMKKLSSWLKLPLWPSDENPFLELPLKKNAPILYVVVTPEVSEEKGREILKSPVACIIDANATKKSIVDFVEQQKTRHRFLLQPGGLLHQPECRWIYRLHRQPTGEVRPSVRQARGRRRSVSLLQS